MKRRALLPMFERLRAGASRDPVLAGVVGLTAFVAYVSTLAPGVTTDADTAMFQFIGRVLGVAHNPGYPLYVLLTHVFSYLPVGSLAYRINLFSALLGAIAVSLAFLIGRRLGSRALVAAAAALGLGFGRVFWSQALIAEVYTLNAAIVSGVILALLVWSDTRRAAWYFAAVALFAAGLGNHTTIVGFAPGIALFVWLVDRRFALRLRTLAFTAAILVAGLLQYLFILIRSNQPGAYVESPATTLGELAGVMLGGQFQDRLFAFGWRALLTERVPTFVRTLFVPELTVVGVALAGVGLAWLARRRLSAAMLLVSGAASVVVFALNYSVIDTPVFLIPAFLVSWLLVAVGGERVTGWLSNRAWRHAVAVLLLAIPAWLAVTNYAVSDRSRDVRAGLELDRLFEALPDRTAFVEEDFIADRMVMGKLLGDGAARGRRIEMTPADPRLVTDRFDAGDLVLAFSKSAERLRFEGFNVSFRRLRLMEGPLGGFLSHLPDGVTVAIAVPAVHSGEFTRAVGASLSDIGGPDDLASIAPSNIAIVGVRGRSGAVVSAGRLGLTLDLRAGDAIGNSGRKAPAEVHVRADPFEAVIGQGARELVRTADGIALAVWAPDGRLVESHVLQASEAFQVPLSSGPLSAYPLRGRWPSERIAADGWSDVVHVFQMGSVMLRIASGETLVLYLGDDTPMAPRVFDTSGRARVDVTSGTSVAAASRDARELDPDRVAALDRDGRVYRIEIDASGDDVSVQFALGGIPSHAFGRVTRPGASRAADVFQVDTRGLLRAPDRQSEVLLMGRDAQSQLTGDGWSPVDWDAAGPFRWMTATEAHVVLPVSGAAGHIRIQALRDDGSPASTVGVRINGAELPPQPLRGGWHVYEWPVPRGRVGPGINEASVLVDRLSGTPSGRAGGHGIAVSDVRLIHDES